jgi:hypothetical protein
LGKNREKSPATGMEVFKTYKQRGEWVELLFMTRAAKRGYVVSKPWGDSARYDVGIEQDGRFKRVQVKGTDCREGNNYSCMLASSKLKLIRPSRLITSPSICCGRTSGISFQPRGSWAKTWLCSVRIAREACMSATKKPGSCSIRENPPMFEGRRPRAIKSSASGQKLRPGESGRLDSRGRLSPHESWRWRRKADSSGPKPARSE